MTPEQRGRWSEIERAKTPEGGWTRETLAAWGVSWPPRKGWKQTLIDNGIPEPVRTEPKVVD